jgi:hypothetical protein
MSYATPHELRHTPEATLSEQKCWTVNARTQLDNLVHMNGLFGFCSEHGEDLPEDIIEDVPR